MSDHLLAAADGATTPLHILRPADLDRFLARRRAGARVQLKDFKAKAGQTAAVLRADGSIELAALGVGDGSPVDAMQLRAAAARLPAGDYRIASAPRGLDRTQAAAAWAMGGYVFDRYRKKPDKGHARLVAEGADLAEARRIAHACALCRDMVNTPANDMGPRQIETIAREVAEQYRAEISVICGDDLLDANYPAIHAVGRAATAERAPRIIEVSWGKKGPRVAVVGKGVVFDTGGLDIKPSSGMRLMKKDMGGAAHALALGRMVMDAGLPVRLTVLLPVVENAISGDAMRPGDIIASRKGLSIEVGNTDAEGRLILADALARAAELEPEVTLDFATLTGAARVALGPQVIPLYTDDEELAGQMQKAAKAYADPVWRMPLWQGYADAVEGDIADLRNDPEPWAQAGSVTAALFLQRFAPADGWAHFDIFAWTPKARPGFPVGAEAQVIRAAYAMLKARFG